MGVIWPHKALKGKELTSEQTKQSFSAPHATSMHHTGEYRPDIMAYMDDFVRFVLFVYPCHIGIC